MKVEIEGKEYEIPDTHVMEYVEALRESEGVELVPPNKYIFGVNVTHTSELAPMGEDIRNFMDTIGDGEVEVQVSVNAKLVEQKDMVVGFDLDAIGMAHETEADTWDEDDDYPEEDKLRVHGRRIGFCRPTGRVQVKEANE